MNEQNFRVDNFQRDTFKAKNKKQSSHAKLNL